jgi:hypothetical protein
MVEAIFEMAFYDQQLSQALVAGIFFEPLKDQLAQFAPGNNYSFTLRLGACHGVCVFFVRAKCSKAGCHLSGFK